MGEKKLRLDYNCIGTVKIPEEQLKTHVHMIFCKNNERVCFHYNDEKKQFELRYEVPIVKGTFEDPGE